jgi:hypothetical protein
MESSRLLVVCTSKYVHKVVCSNVLMIYTFGSGRTIEVAASRSSRIHNDNGQLGMHVVNCLLLQSLGIRKDAILLFGFLFRNTSGIGGTAKETTSCSSRIGSDHGHLGMHVVDRELLEPFHILQDTILIFGFLFRNTFGSRGAIKLAAGCSSGISCDYRQLGIYVDDYLLFQSLDIKIRAVSSASSSEKQGWYSRILHELIPRLELN